MFSLRGFGASEGMFITESVIHAIAEKLSMPVHKIQVS
jgi:CO/xanthine dehydrogenase Mo-binding subunit